MITPVTSSHDGIVDGTGDKSSARPLSADDHVQQQQQKAAVECSRNYIRSLLENDLQAACFDEKLKIFSNCNEVGQLTISISTVSSDGGQQILVQAASTGSVEAIPCGTTVEAYLTMNGRTVLQHHHEHVDLTDNPIERDTYIKLEDDHYAVQCAVQQAKGLSEKSLKFSLDEMKCVVPEGLNLLLLRLLAMKGMPPDDLELLTLDATGRLCPIRYRAVKSEVFVVDGQELQSVAIERSMYHNNNNNKTVTWLTHFAHDGRLLYRTQVGSAITMRLCDPQTAVNSADDNDEVTPRPVIPQKPLDWENDVQLHSKFLDRKAELEASHSEYLRQNPEVHAMVADFLQHLLLHKPSNVFKTSVDYFSTFQSQAPPGGHPYKLSPANC